MNKDIKIIFVDIDNTIFVHPEKYFDIPSVEAIKQAQKNGIKICIATARPYHAAKEIGSFDIIKPDYIISGNGATIFDHDKLIYSDYFNDKDLKDFIKVVNKYNFNAEFIEEKTCFLINNYMRRINQYFKEFCQLVPSIGKYTNQKITKALLFMPKKYDEKMLPLLPSSIVYYRFSDNLIDVMPVQAYKGFGVKYLLNYLNIASENALAIGDERQDISMFNEVKYSVAMDNGPEEVKKTATYVAKSIRESGVKDILIKLGVID